MAILSVATKFRSSIAVSLSPVGDRVLIGTEAIVASVEVASEVLVLAVTLTPGGG